MARRAENSVKAWNLRMERKQKGRSRRLPRSSTICARTTNGATPSSSRSNTRSSPAPFSPPAPLRVWRRRGEEGACRGSCSFLMSKNTERGAGCGRVGELKTNAVGRPEGEGFGVCKKERIQPRFTQHYFILLEFFLNNCELTPLHDVRFGSSNEWGVIRTRTLHSCTVEC